MLKEFNQESYASASGANTFASTGYVYYPKRCLKQQCKVHLALHGCNGQARDAANLYGPYVLDKNAVFIFP